MFVLRGLLGWFGFLQRVREGGTEGLKCAVCAVAVAYGNLWQAFGFLQFASPTLLHVFKLRLLQMCTAP